MERNTELQFKGKNDETVSKVKEYIQRNGFQKTLINRENSKIQDEKYKITFYKSGPNFV